MDYIHSCRSPLGRITLAACEGALIGLWFEGQRYFASSLDRDCREAGLPVFREAERWLDCYFSGEIPGFTPPLAPRGTDYRKAVWDTLLTIPYGDTATYGDVAVRTAARLGFSRGSARAAGAAVGRNPISLIIPCHRVIGAGGQLTGYAGGLDRKAYLLDLERRHGR